MISFVVITYANQDTLSRCIDSIVERVFPFEYEIILFNNGPDRIDAGIGMGSSIKVIESENNLGFAKGCNEAAKNASFPFLFFINPDAEFVSGNFSQLVDLLKVPHVAVVSPHLLSSDGKAEDWSMGRHLTPFRILMNNFFPRKLAGFQSSAPDWVSGAAFAVKKSVFEQFNGFDERFFMYFEDVDFCRRVKLKGFDIIKTKSIMVMHGGGASFSDKRTQKRMYYESQDAYLRKHFGFLVPLFIKLLRVMVKK